MEIRPLRDDDVRTFVRNLWLPFRRELESTTERNALADDVDLVAAETAFLRDQLDDDDHRAWVAVDDDEFAGFLSANLHASPSVFARPDRLVVNDLYVREPYRGSGLASELVDRAADCAADRGHGELALNVDVDNERARAFYEKLGFETVRLRMAVAVDDL